MFDALKRLVLRVLRVPAEPRVPVGAGQVRVFRAAPSYFRLKLLVWGAGQLGALAGLVGGLLFVQEVLARATHPWVVFALTAAEVLAWGAFLVQIPFSLAVMRLDYEMRWYILSDRSLRIREGVVSVREKTLTFANIQQISIRQNPVQRLLGIADVQVSTAGGGSGGGHQGAAETMHEAFFRGVDNAEEIRSVIRERVRLHRDAGLGDPDEPAPLALPPPPTRSPPPASCATRCGRCGAGWRPVADGGFGSMGKTEPGFRGGIWTLHAPFCPSYDTLSDVRIGRPERFPTFLWDGQTGACRVPTPAPRPGSALPMLPRPLTPTRRPDPPGDSDRAHDLRGPQTADSCCTASPPGHHTTGALTD